MAVSDNTNYELSGSQVKDLAARIKSKATNTTFIWDSGSMYDINNNAVNADAVVAAFLNGTVSVDDIDDGPVGKVVEYNIYGTYSDEHGVYHDVVAFTVDFTAQNGVVTRKQYINEPSLIGWIEPRTISISGATYSDFTGATSSTAGAHGLVPAPAAGDDTKFLKGDGTWATAGGGGDQKIYVTMGSWNSDGDKCTLTLYSDEALTQTMTQSEFKAIANSSDDVTFVFVNGSTTPASVLEVSYASRLQIWEPTQYSQRSLVRYWINSSLFTTSNYSQKPHIDWDSRNANAQLIFVAPENYVSVLDSNGTGTFVLAGYSQNQNDFSMPDSTNRYAVGWYDNSANKIYFELDTGLNFDGFPQTVELLDKGGYGQFNPQIMCRDRSNSSIFMPVTFAGIPNNCTLTIECDTTAGSYGDPTGTLKLKFTISPTTTVRFEGTVFIFLKGIEIGTNMNF